MPVLPNYSDVFVIQRQPHSGCIPSAIEWMLKYLKVDGIDFNGFQEKYDLVYQKKGDNHFGNIPKLIMQDYPQTSFLHRGFNNGREKIDFITDLLNKRIPVLISITMTKGGGWHIAPVVEIDPNRMMVLWMDKSSIDEQKKSFDTSRIEFIHNEWRGGGDILYWNKQS